MKNLSVWGHTDTSHLPQPTVLDMAGGSDRWVITTEGSRAGVAPLSCTETQEACFRLEDGGQGKQRPFSLADLRCQGNLPAEGRGKPLSGTAWEVS